MRDAALGISGEYYIERDDGRLETLSTLDYVRPILEWNELERLAIQHAKGNVLDIGCGAGRVAIYLQNLGHRVVGIDMAPGAVEACKMRGLRDAHIMSVAGLNFPESTFDTVIMFGNNFGLLGDDEKIISMLQELHRITTPDGIILAGSAEVEKTDDTGHLRYHELNVSRNKPKGLIRLRVKYKGFIDDWVELRLASPNEMSVLAERSGWRLDRKYQRGGPYVGLLVKS